MVIDSYTFVPILNGVPSPSVENLSLSAGWLSLRVAVHARP